MNSFPVKAILTWEPHKLFKPPTSGEYVTIARFEDEVEWPKEAWSIRFRSKDGNMSTDRVIGFVSFIVEDAPFAKLRSGTKFDLYEGFKKSAKILIM